MSKFVAFGENEELDKLAKAKEEDEQTKLDTGLQWKLKINPVLCGIKNETRDITLTSISTLSVLLPPLARQGVSKVSLWIRREAWVPAILFPKCVLSLHLVHFFSSLGHSALCPDVYELYGRPSWLLWVHAYQMTEARNSPIFDVDLDTCCSHYLPHYFISRLITSGLVYHFSCTFHLFVVAFA